MAKKIVSLTARDEEQAPYRVLNSNELAKKLSKASELSQKLQALLLMTYGEAGASFRSMCDLHQENYMWVCANLSDELEALVSETESMVSVVIAD